MAYTKAEFERVRQEAQGWRVAPEEGKFLPMWRHRMCDAEGGRITISAGDYRVGVTATPTYFDVYGWHDAPGLPARVELEFVDRIRDGRAKAEITFWNERGFGLNGAWSEGEVDWVTGRGRFALNLELGQETVAARKGVVEGAVGTLMAMVLRDGGVLLHAATLEVDGCAVVVVGASGRGKSTLCRRFPSHFMNEEFAFLSPTGPGGSWQSHWYAQERAAATERPPVLPLGGLFLLSERRDRSAAWRATTADALTVLHSSSLWVPGIPVEIHLAAHESLLSRHPPRSMSHSLTSCDADVLGVLRSLT